MAISGFGRGKEGTTAASSPGSASSATASGGFGNLTAFIDQGSEFEGKLSFKDTVRIDGSFSGEITSDNTLIVGESGQITATIQSVSVVVSGLVEGDVTASQEIVLHKTAVVKGDLVAPSIVMEKGAQLNGSVRMTGTAGGGTASPAPTASKPKDKAEGQGGNA